MMALSAKSGRTCRFTLGLLIFTGCCFDFVRAQTGNRYGLDPATIQNPFYSNIPTNTYSNYYNSYYNRNPSQGYYGNYPGYNYNYNYYPATTTPPPPTYLPANTAPNPAASAGGGGGETEAEDGVSTTGEATQTGSGYYARQAIPASSGTRLPLYGDWNPPIGSVFGSGRVGLLESRAPYYNYNNNNYNNNNYGYGYAQQQQNNWNPFMTMMAFDMW